MNLVYHFNTFWLLNEQLHPMWGLDTLQISLLLYILRMSYEFQNLHIHFISFKILKSYNQQIP
jgi:hypothetical protein